jgi:hypothetical protein
MSPAAGGLEPLVDLGVDARDEERGDGVAVERLALRVAALHRVEERLHHALVVRDREQQRDVDVEALVERLLDRGDPGVGGRDLDHHVGPVDQLPVLAGLLERALGVMGEPRARPRATRSRPCRRSRRRPGAARRSELDVLDRHPAVDLARAQAFAGERGELLVVVGRAEDRLLEDRRIRGHAAERVLLHHALELAGLDRASPDLIEPDAGPGRGQRGKALVDLLDAHGLRSLPISDVGRKLAQSPRQTATGSAPRVLQNASTTRGSNCVPEQRRSSASASASERTRP